MTEGYDTFPPPTFDAIHRPRTAPRGLSNRNVDGAWRPGEGRRQERSDSGSSILPSLHEQGLSSILEPRPLSDADAPQHASLSNVSGQPLSCSNVRFSLGGMDSVLEEGAGIGQSRTSTFSAPEFSYKGPWAYVKCDTESGELQDPVIDEDKVDLCARDCVMAHELAHQSDPDAQAACAALSRHHTRTNGGRSGTSSEKKAYRQAVRDFYAAAGQSECKAAEATLECISKMSDIKCCKQAQKLKKMSEKQVKKKKCKGD